MVRTDGHGESKWTNAARPQLTNVLKVKYVFVAQPEAAGHAKVNGLADSRGESKWTDGNAVRAQLTDVEKIKHVFGVHP